MPQLNRRNRKGFSLIELLIVVAIILIIAMVAIPKMNVQLMSAREMSAIREITSIHQAQTQYYSQFGRYAETLVQLGPPTSGSAGPQAADLLTASLANATGKKGGYIFAVTPTQTGYAVTAVPERYGSDGRRTFYSDQTLEVHENWSAEPATAQSPVLGQSAAATGETK